MNRENRRPVLVGAGQYIERGFDPGKALDPLSMMAIVCRLAAADSGAGNDLLRHIESLAVINSITWKYPDLPGMLAEALAISPKERFYTPGGGQGPQEIINYYAQKIEEGKLDAALIVGGEAFYSLRKAMRAGQKLPWPVYSQNTPVNYGKIVQGVSALETEYGLFQPVHIYPFFENAIRAHQGRNIDSHQRSMGRLMSGLTQVAVENPYAWFNMTQSPEELVSANSSNRMISFPYTKKLCAMIDVNQSAALLMMPASRAKSLRIPEEKWVYIPGRCDANEDPWFFSERPDFYSCPAMTYAAQTALGQSGLGINDIDYLDLYSCFPCAVEIARDSLGIGENDPRPLTVTGGLPYAGGPLHNYVTHALAAMMAKLREKPGSSGLVTANGYYLTKHAAGVYSTAPRDPVKIHLRPAPAAAPSSKSVEFTREAHGNGIVETYTVIHNPAGDPETGIVIGRLNDGHRFIACTPTDRKLLEDLMVREAVGLKGAAEYRDGHNLFKPA